MINDYKKLCYQSAQIIPGWENIDKNELCRLYVKERDKDIANGYLSAILYKFWNITESNYYKQKYKLATEGDCIDWTTTGILYALNHHVWDDESNSLYNDPKGPEKAINVCIYSTKVNFYQKIKHHKEKSFYDSLSLDNLMENASDAYYFPCTDEDNISTSLANQLVKEAFLNKDYLKAFVLDGILTMNVFDTEVEGGDRYTIFSEKRLRKYIRNTDYESCSRFSKIYDVEYKVVVEALKSIKKSSVLTNKVRKVLESLKQDDNIIQYIWR